MILSLTLAFALQSVNAEFATAASKDYGAFESAVRSVAFSEDDAYVFGASDSEIIVFDATRLEEKARIDVFGPSAVSSRVALRGGIDSYTRIDLPELTGGTLTRFEGLGFPKTDVLGFAALSHNGSGAMVSGIAFRSVLHAGADPKPFDHEKFSVTAVAVGPFGKLFAMGSLAGEVRLVDGVGKTVFSSDAKAGAVVSLAFSRQGDAFALGTGDGSIKVYRNDPWWVKASGSLGGMVYALSWSPAGDVLAAAASKPSAGGRVFLIDPKTGKTLAKWEHTSGVYALAFNSKGDQLAIGCEDGVIRVKALRR